MSDVQDLLSKAQALGEALAAHPAVRAHYEARRDVRADASANELLRDYQVQLDRLRQLERDRQPVEVADKHKLKDLENRVAGSEVLKRLMRTQADFVALMTQVNHAIDDPMARLAAPAPDPGPSK
jgi:cell fate (sporulation/competence/biofilm development) regulator YlbF (YheA/YmcA/DUF963 family)